MERVQIEKWKRTQLKDLNTFVSPTRLCVRNLPPDLGDQGLKKLFKKHGVVVEARVMREFISGEKSGKSKEFGFVAFREHESALAALRELNNNPSVFRADARPIVEFSIE